MAPESPPATRIRPSRRMLPLCAMSSTPKRLIVFTGFRVLELKIWTREPVVIANRSEEEPARPEGAEPG